MIESVSVSHHIQKHIIDVLMYTPVARFKDLRPDRVDTNLFTYHLKALVTSKMVNKVEGGYALSPAGLSYVDRVSTEKKVIRTQPKIITMLVIQNENGDVLLQRRSKQPYIATWTLPYGKLHIEDTSTQEAAQREAFEKLGLNTLQLEHAGDCYIRVTSDGIPLSTTLAHVFRAFDEYPADGEAFAWVQPHKLGQLPLAPAVQEVVARTFFKDPFYFEDFTTEWPSEQ